MEQQEYLGITYPLATILQRLLSLAQKHLATADEWQRHKLWEGDTDSSKLAAVHGKLHCAIGKYTVQVKVSIGKSMTIIIKQKMQGCFSCKQKM